MNKNILILGLCFLLVSCGDSQEWVVTGLSLHEGNTFQMSVPSNWSVITQDSQILPSPKTSQIELAVSSEELKYGFSNNLLILSQKLDKKVSSTDFSILNNVWSSREYVEYLKLESKSIDFLDSDTSNIYIFEAKYNIQTPKFKYLQVGKVCKDTGYLVTIALSTDIKDTSKYEEMIKTFQCK